MLPPEGVGRGLGELVRVSTVLSLGEERAQFRVHVTEDEGQLGQLSPVGMGSEDLGWTLGLPLTLTPAVGDTHRHQAPRLYNHSVKGQSRFQDSLWQSRHLPSVNLGFLICEGKGGTAQYPSCPPANRPQPPAAAHGDGRRSPALSEEEPTRAEGFGRGLRAGHAWNLLGFSSPGGWTPVFSPASCLPGGMGQDVGSSKG